jgi:hypothetical protein
VSTCERTRLSALLVVLVVAAVSACGGADPVDCLRFSDCAEGLTCAYGHCVVPPSPASADATAGDGAASTGDDASAPGASGNDSSDDASLFPTSPSGSGDSGFDAASE